MQLPLSLIRTDGGTQPRATLNAVTVQEYAEALREGAAFPPVTVFHDGSAHWLADGFHRYHAHRLAERETIEADIRQGTHRDAILHSTSANAAHGLRRTNLDKRTAVMRLLEDEEWSQWSDTQIARHCGVSQPFVSNLRGNLITDLSEQPTRRYVTKHGTEATMMVGNIGRGRVELPPKIERDRVAGQPRTPPLRPHPSMAAVAEEGGSIELGRKLAAEADEGPAWGWQRSAIQAARDAMGILPAAAKAVAHAPPGLTAEECDRWADWWGDLALALESREGADDAR